MQAFGDSGRIYEVSLAYFARDVRVERLQLDAPLHSHHRITGSTLYIIMKLVNQRWTVKSD